MDIEEVGVSWILAKENEKVWLLSATKILDLSPAVLVKLPFRGYDMFYMRRDTPDIYLRYIISPFCYGIIFEQGCSLTIPGGKKSRFFQY